MKFMDVCLIVTKCSKSARTTLFTNSVTHVVRELNFVNWYFSGQEHTGNVDLHTRSSSNVRTWFQPSGHVHSEHHRYWSV